MNEKYLPNTPALRRWHLVEEMAEVAKEMSKLERFGPDGDPDFQTQCKIHGTPRQRLLREMQDLKWAIEAVIRDLNQ